MKEKSKKILANNNSNINPKKIITKEEEQESEDLIVYATLQELNGEAKIRAETDKSIIKELLIFKEIQINEVEAINIALAERDRVLENLEKKWRQEINQLFQDLATKLNKAKWVIGEYKWMPIGSTMPEGWVKVAIGPGHTLVQGINPGSTSGSLKKHSHTFISKNNKGRVWSVGVNSQGKANVYFWEASPRGTARQSIIPFVKKYSDSDFPEETADQGEGISNQNNNLAAGLFAELWQYQGLNL